MSPLRLAEILPLVYVPLRSDVKEPADVPYLKPHAVILPLRLLNEPDRVAPVWLISVAVPVVTAALGWSPVGTVGSGPPAPPPDSVQ